MKKSIGKYVTQITSRDGDLVTFRVYQYDLCIMADIHMLVEKYNALTEESLFDRMNDEMINRGDI